MTTITPDMCETYIAAVAAALDNAGHKTPELPSPPYVFDADSGMGITGSILLPDALTDGADHAGLALEWDSIGGWQAGYPRAGDGIDCLTDLYLDVAPPPSVIVQAVQAIVADDRDDLTAGRVRAYPAELLATYTGQAETGEAAQQPGRERETADPADMYTPVASLADAVARYRDRASWCAHDDYQRVQIAAWDEIATVLEQLLGDRQARGHRG